MVCKLGPQKVATYGVLGDLWWWRLMVYTDVFHADGKLYIGYTS